MPDTAHARTPTSPSAPGTSSPPQLPAGATVPSAAHTRRPSSAADLRALLLSSAAPDGPSRAWRAPGITRAWTPIARTLLHLQSSRRAMGTIIGVSIALAIVLAAFAARALVTPTAAPAGRVSFVSDTPGVAVAVDGAARGLTPLTIDLAPGRHAVTLTNDGRTDSISVTVEPGGRDVHHVYPAPPPRVPTHGTLRITSPRPGARITLDGEYRGVTPMTFATLTEGVHRVTLVQGSITEHRNVLVEPDKMTELTLALGTMPAPPPPPPQSTAGWIEVSGPSGLEIRERGELIGAGGVPRVMLPAGTHDLEFVGAAFNYRARRTVRVTAGRTTSIVLEMPRGALNVNALPWAEVWLDGRRLGETPLGNVAVPVGAHELILRNPQLGERRISVTVRVGEPTRVGADLRQ